MYRGTSAALAGLQIQLDTGWARQTQEKKVAKHPAILSSLECAFFEACHMSPTPRDGGKTGGRTSHRPAVLALPPLLAVRLMARVSFCVIDFDATAGLPFAGRLRAFSCSCGRTTPAPRQSQAFADTCDAPLPLAGAGNSLTSSWQGMPVSQP